MLKNQYSMSGSRKYGRSAGRKKILNLRGSDKITITVFAIVLTAYAMFGPGINGQASADTDTNDALETENQDSQKAVSAVKTSATENYQEISDEYLAEISDFDVLVLKENGNVDSVPVEQYVAGVVASEMPSSFDLEALKAQAVAARTYVTSRRDSYNNGKSKHTGAYVCATTCCQVYRNTEELRKVKSDDWIKTDYNKVKTAVSQTAGQLLYYDGELVTQPLFFSASGGKTENSEDVFSNALPYLRSVSSSYENAEKYNNFETVKTYDELKKLLSSYGTVNLTPDNIKVLSLTEGDGVALAAFDTLQLTGRQVRELLELPSADFTIKTTDDNVTFITNGSGHRVGLSQYGADGMAANGYNYKEILQHYYSGTSIA